MKSFLFAAIGLLALSMTSYAGVQATYYISPSGTGTTFSSDQPGPLSGIQAKVRSVNTNMTGDIVVVLRGGTYPITAPLAFTAQDGGTGSNKVIYQAATGERPIISGGRAIANWSQRDATLNIWKASAGGANTRQFWVNGTRAIRAHLGHRKFRSLCGDNTPNVLTNGNLSYDYNSVKLSVNTSPSTVSIPVTTLASGGKAVQDWGNQSAIELIFNGFDAGRITAHNNVGDANYTWFVSFGARGYQGLWQHSRVGVTGITSSGGSAVFAVRSGDFSNILSTSLYKSERQRTPTDIENAYELIDEEGEWYLDRAEDTIYYKPRSGETMSSAQALVPQVEKLLTIIGTSSAPVNNLSFDGVFFAYSTWLGPNTQGYGDGQGGFSLHSGFPQRTPGAVSCSYINNVSFQKCRFEHIGSGGLDFDKGSKNTTINGCIVRDISQTGIQVDSRSTSNSADQIDGITITNNLITNLSLDYNSGHGIWLGFCKNITANHNEISYVGYTGIAAGTTMTSSAYDANFSIQYNYIHDVMLYLSDGGAIYAHGNQNSTTPSTWSNNYIVNVFGDGKGIYFDQKSTYINAANNVILKAYAHWVQCGTSSFFDNQAHIHVSNTFAQSDERETASASTLSGADVTIAAPTIVSPGSLPAAAQAIVNAAGIEAAYRDTGALTSIRQRPNATVISSSIKCFFAGDKLIVSGGLAALHTIEIIDCAGRRIDILSRSSKAGDCSILLPELSPGMYVIQLTEKNRAQMVAKFIVH